MTIRLSEARKNRMCEPTGNFLYSNGSKAEIQTDPLPKLAPETWVSLTSAGLCRPAKSCGGVVTARYTNGSLLVLVTPWIVPAGVRTTSPARKPVCLAVILQKQGATLLNEPYLFAHRVHMSCRDSARLHRDPRDRDPGFGRIIGPHDLHRSKAGILQGCEVCRRETLDGQNRCRPFTVALLHYRPATSAPAAAEHADRRHDRANADDQSEIPAA
jgi:hypothetical protein